MVFSLLMLFNVIYFAKINCDLNVCSFLKRIVFNCFFSFFLALTVSMGPVFIITNEFVQFVVVCMVSVISYLLFIWLLALSLEERIMITNVKDKMLLLVKKSLGRNKYTQQ